ncbi:hypothetical protein Pta02_37780 [Planobispora takensis]|uniref:Uncharacterized protein n=1 Tax=Planobispora takensis TaxID=1367882 RepID=A0A8J3T0K5_9ACTN|nr:hypothetical protein Pta02_37780 [Planobispora takensis]
MRGVRRLEEVACLSVHPAPRQPECEPLQWLPPQPVGVVAYTCGCRNVSYELCHVNGQAFVRRTVRLADGHVIEETHRMPIHKAREFWERLLRGEIQ